MPARYLLLPHHLFTGNDHVLPKLHAVGLELDIEVHLTDSFETVTVDIEVHPTWFRSPVPPDSSKSPVQRDVSVKTSHHTPANLRNQASIAHGSSSRNAFRVRRASLRTCGSGDCMSSLVVMSIASYIGLS